MPALGGAPVLGRKITCAWACRPSRATPFTSMSMALRLRVLSEARCCVIPARMASASLCCCLHPHARMTETANAATAATRSAFFNFVSLELERESFRNLHLNKLQFSNLLASLGGQICWPEGDADLLQKCRGRLAAGEDPHVVVGFNQAIHYFRKILAFHAEFAGASTLSNRENNGAGAVAALGGVDRENPIRAFDDGFDFFAFAKPEIYALQNLVPESE